MTRDPNDNDDRDEPADDWGAWTWNPVDQGMYDDDPNPYHGTYSED